MLRSLMMQKNLYLQCNKVYTQTDLRQMATARDPTVQYSTQDLQLFSNSNLGTSSKEAHAKQKQLIAERKASKPLAEQLARTKKIWERLRRKSHVPLEERKKLVEEL